MKFTRTSGMFLCLLLLQMYLPAQDKTGIKFGKIAVEDFDLSKYTYDSGASAVIIADIGNTSFVGNNKDNFTLVFKRFKRVKILNKNGFDIAKEEIGVYHDGTDEEELANLKAVTYNIENGKIVETKLDESAIFVDKIDKNRSVKKFTFPAVKEGSIIELEYTIKSDFYIHLRPWSFQGEYPCLWSEYEVSVPKFFNYVSLTRGDQSYYIKTAKTSPAYYSVRVPRGTESDDIVNLTTILTDNRWVMKDVPALKTEKFTSTLLNHLSRIEFQLHYKQYTDESERYDYMGNWSLASEKLLKDEYFGAALNKDNHWMTAELAEITAGSTSNFEKIKKIYAYIRDNFTCTDHDELYAYTPLKTVFTTKHGNVAEINMLLIAMLRHENIDADPVILSTRDNGFTDEVYPLIRQFNYVISVVRNDDKTYCLDASLPKLGFACLSSSCYNGSARTINTAKPYILRFDTDSLSEPKNSTVIIINDDKNQWTGSFQSTLGKMASYDLRYQINKSGQKGFFAGIQNSLGSELEIENPGIDSLSLLEEPVQVHYDFNFKKGEDSDRIYFNPMLSETYKENPFKAAVRKYPVEMTYKVDETYNLNLEIPNGYTVEELPKSARVLLNEKDGIFEYLIQKSDNNIQLRSRIKLERSVFLPEDYNTLRDFYAYVVKKQSEQIVFKKK
jgi:hypothetical protein